MERINTYRQWLESEGLPVIGGYSVPDVMEAPVKPWPRKGGLGAHINLIGSEDTMHAYVCEIPPGKSLLPQRHLYEELIYILDGEGASSVWVEGGKKQSFEWHAGSLFAPPLNAWHQHFNGQSARPVRYLGITAAPTAMNLYHDLDFVFNNDYVFKKRFSGEENFFSSEGKPLAGDENIDNPKIWESNFIPDCRTFPLADDPARGGFQTNAFFELSSGQISAHISEFPEGTYMKAHYHDAGAHLICLSGQGYELMWPVANGINSEGFERLKIDWHAGTLFSPPDRTFHQHFNSGKGKTRILAFHNRSMKFASIIKLWGRTKSFTQGGTQLEYADEDPTVRKLFKQELARNGATWNMSKYFPGE